MNKSERPFLNTPSACHRNAVRPSQPRFRRDTEPQAPRTDRSTRGARGAPSRSPSLSPAQAAALDQGNLLPACSRAASSARVWFFLRLRREMPPGALPPRGLPAAPPRAALIKAEALGAFICPLCPPKNAQTKTGEN